MSSKNTYTLTGEELRNMIRETVNRIVTENKQDEYGFLGLDFGIERGLANGRKIKRLSNDYAILGKRVENVHNELIRRISVIYNSISANKQLKEGVAGAVVSSGAKVGRKIANVALNNKKTALQLTLWFAADMLSEKAIEHGIPQTIETRIRELQNPQMQTPQYLEKIYSEMAMAMKNICSKLVEEEPYVIGAILSADLVNDYCFIKEKTYLPNFEVEIEDGSLLELFLQIGISCIPYVGPVYDILDIVGTLTSAKGREDEQTLGKVENMKRYIIQAVRKFEEILNLSKRQSMEELRKRIKASANNVPAQRDNTNVSPAIPLAGRNIQQNVNPTNMEAIKNRLNPTAPVQK